jgi:hypothetical protein
VTGKTPSPTREETKMLYRGYRIEAIGEKFLIHTGGMYGYYYFATIEAAKAWVNERKA